VKLLNREYITPVSVPLKKSRASLHNIPLPYILGLLFTPECLG